MLDRLFALASTIRRIQEGPLGPYVDGFAEFLVERGYRVSTVRWRIQLITNFNRWFERHSLQIRDLKQATIHRFLQTQPRRRLSGLSDGFGVRLFTTHLEESGILPPELCPMTSDRTCHPLLIAFTNYLEKERGLAPATVSHYLHFVRLFLPQKWDGDLSSSRFSADRVVRFVVRHVRSYRPGTAKLMVTALRAFFRFLRARGDITSNLVACLPTVPSWRLAVLPKSLRPEEVDRVLEAKACNHHTPAGRRDFAILLLLARLGLRAGEIVRLEIEDLHWEAGEITVCGKGGCQNRLPLPREVGKALVAYLKQDRPRQCPTRRVFVRAYPPFTGFADSSSISTLVRQALLQAGLRPPRKGAHLFRHAVASRMLDKGATLVEIGEVLRHRHPDTTAIYAKVDVARLRSLAQPWPGGRP